MLVSKSFFVARVLAILTYVAAGEVTTLKHELGDDTVEGGALVVEGLARLAGTLLTSAESAEVLSGLQMAVSYCRIQQTRLRRQSIGEDSDGGVLTLGTWSLKSSISILPAGWPPMEMSKKTWGLDMLIVVVFVSVVKCVVVECCCVER